MDGDLQRHAAKALRVRCEGCSKAPCKVRTNESSFPKRQILIEKEPALWPFRGRACWTTPMWLAEIEWL